MNTYHIANGLKAAMREAGIKPPKQVIADGVLHRFHIAGQKPGSRNGAYKLHVTGTKPAGYFEDFKTGIKANWKADGPAKTLTHAEREKIQAAKLQSERQRAERYEQAAQTAQKLLNQSVPAAGRLHPYLERKRVEAHNLKILPSWAKRKGISGGGFENLVIKNVLLIPLVDISGKLWNVQAIFPEPHESLGRDKDFLAGGRLGGLFHPIGPPGGEVLVCEGFATGASLHKATGIQTLCAMTAGNLLTIAKAVRSAYPGTKIIICADNDEKTPGNPGLSAAKNAALAVGGFLAVPPIAGDFNDMAMMDEAGV